MSDQQTGAFTGEAPPRTILGVDFGSVHTRVVFFDVVDGQYRLVSRAQTLTTAEPPIGDVTVGLFRALEEITSVIGRQFIVNNRIVVGGATSAAGVDQFVATASGGRPMRAVLVGLMPDVSLASGRRALGSIYVELADVISVGDLRSQEQQVNALLSQKPDLIFIVGGTDEGARDSMIGLINVVQLAVSLLPTGQRPVILYAGNEALQPEVKALLESETQVFMASNVRPRLADEHLGGAQLELAVAYGTYKASNPGGFGDVQSISRLGVLPTANSYTNVIRYLGELMGAGLGVLCVDVGSSTVTLCATINKRPSINIHPDLGLGHSAVSGIEQIGPDNVLRWLTYRASASDVVDYAWNKTLNPSSVPQTFEDMEMEYALARELIRAALNSSRQVWQDIPRTAWLPPLRPIIGAGAVLTQSLEPGMSALLLLDALQPAGVTELKLDPYGAIAALGGIAYLNPLAMVQVLENGGLLDLGTAICPEGHTKDPYALQVTMKYPSGRTISAKVAAGELETIDLPAGQKAYISLQLGRGMSLNGKSSLSLTINGGASGIILDGRGRSLVLPAELGRRKEVFTRWYTAMHGLQAVPQPEAVPISQEG